MSGRRRFRVISAGLTTSAMSPLIQASSAFVWGIPVIVLSRYSGMLAQLISVILGVVMRDFRKISTAVFLLLALVGPASAQVVAIGTSNTEGYGVGSA